MSTLNNRKKALFAGGIVLVIVGILLAVFTEPIYEYLFLSGNESTMQIIMQPRQISAVKASIGAYFGSSNRTYTLQDLFQ